MGVKHLEIWQNCLELIKTNIDPQTFATWFEPIMPYSYDNGVFTIQVPSAFFVECLEDRFIHLLRPALSRAVNGVPLRLQYKVIVDQGTSVKSNPTFASSASSNDNRATAQGTFFTPSGLKQIPINSQLNKNYTFENFIEGACNRLARSSGNSIAEAPGRTPFNPIFIFGGSGLGKTHLAHAIGLKAKELNPNLKIQFVSANQFQTQYTNSVRNNKQNDFLNYYQMMDMLIIDDIHEFSGKEKTQNTFFHIFNHLHQSGKQLVLTSDKSVSELKGVSERLLTRFKWNLQAELEKPDFETKLKIVKHKANRDGLDIEEDILVYLAENLGHSIRELEGALISLMAQSMHNKKNIDLKLAETVVQQITQKAKRAITLEKIMEIVSSYFSVKQEDLTSKSRKREIAHARQVVMYLAKTHTNDSLVKIGHHLGNRDHATIAYGYKTISDLKEIDKQFANVLKKLEMQVSS